MVEMYQPGTFFLVTKISIVIIFTTKPLDIELKSFPRMSWSKEQRKYIQFEAKALFITRFIISHRSIYWHKTRPTKVQLTIIGCKICHVFSLYSTKTKPVFITQLTYSKVNFVFFCTTKAARIAFFLLNDNNWNNTDFTQLNYTESGRLRRWDRCVGTYNQKLTTVDLFEI